MDTQPTLPHRKASLPTFGGGGSLPVEVAAVLPASTRSSFTRVENNTRPGTAAGENDNNDVCLDGAAVPSDGALATPGEEDNDDDDDEREQAGEAAAAAAPPPPPLLPAAVVPQVPQTLVQFLLVSGRRRSMAFDPETTVGRVKELAWNSWPNDWQDERPPAPSFLRILYLGKILQDDDTLTQLKFPSYTPPEPATPTIVHLSIRSFAPREDAALKKKSAFDRMVDS